MVSLLLRLAVVLPVELGEKLHTIFFSPSADCGLCGDDEPLPCGSRGGDVDSFMAWLLTSSFNFFSFACNAGRMLYVTVRLAACYRNQLYMHTYRFV